MRWDDVELFLAIARGGSLTAAGLHLELNPSTVLRRLDALEADLGVRLFDRDSRGASLTSLGESLVPAAQRMEEEAQAIVRRSQREDAAVSGTVRVTMPPELCDLVADAIATLRRGAPGLVVELHAGTRRYDLGREADIALRLAEHAPPDVEADHVAAAGWAVYLRRDAPADAGWVHYAPGTLAVCAWRWQSTQPSLVPLARSVTVAGVHALIRSMPARGVLPCFLGTGDPLLRADGPVVARTDLWLLTPPGHRRSERVRTVVDVLRDHLHTHADLLVGGP